MPFPLVDHVHQVLAPDGSVVGAVPELPEATLRDLYRWLVFGRVFSDRMVALQRQGRIGTFGPLNGQEAASVGLAAPLGPEDWLVGSYREILSYIMRGVPPLAMLQAFRGMVAPYPREARCLPFQIVLGAQMPHAVGLAMAIRYDGGRGVVVGVCGDGATSEGDFNEALNFAAVFKAPVVFVVQNNGWAISVPRHRQTVAEYLAHRGPAFGLPGYVVDGNDVLAVYDLVRRCCERARDPLVRYRRFLIDRGLLDEVEDVRLREAADAEIEREVERVEALPPPDPAAMFDLVFADPTPQLADQRGRLIDKLPAGDAAGR